MYKDLLAAVGPFSVLLYGDAGAGKTTLAVDAFWDFMKLEKRCEGLWIQLGRESNTALGVPVAMTKSFSSTLSDPMKFLNSFNACIRGVAVERLKGAGPEVVVVDGLTEFGALYEYYKTPSASDTFEVWRGLKDSFFGAMQLLNPEFLKCVVICTASVDVKRRGTKTKSQEVIGADPDWQDSKFVPYMDGWARRHMGRYFNLVAYMDADYRQVKGADGKLEKKECHDVWFQGHGDYLIKNQWEHRWEGLPPKLTNARFEEVLGLIAKAKGSAAGA